MTEQQPTPADDAEGHVKKAWADAERDESGDDAEGHGKKVADAERDESGDVEGHLSGALGRKKRDGYQQ